MGRYQKGIVTLTAAIMAIAGSCIFSHASAESLGSSARPETGTVSSTQPRVQPILPIPSQSASSLAGINWPEGGRVYVAHMNQQTVLASDPSRVYRIAKQLGLHTVRVFLGDDVIFDKWKTNPTTVLNDIQPMLDDAQANGVRLVISNYLTQQGVEKLAGRTYPNWQDAQRDLVMPGSTPYKTLDAWEKAVIGRYGSHPAAYSWEVTNEPGWMLGLDAGTVNTDAGIAFLGYFQKQLHAYGAKQVNGGSVPYHAPSLLTDDQIKTYGANLDILDNHFYPPTDSAGVAYGSAAEAQKEIDNTQAYFQRARTLLRRPNMPGMIGEFGSTPSGWFQYAAQQSVNHGWQTNVWAFDAYDQHNFTDTHRPEVLDYMKRLQPQ